MIGFDSSSMLDILKIELHQNHNKNSLSQTDLNNGHWVIDVNKN